MLAMDLHHYGCYSFGQKRKPHGQYYLQNNFLLENNAMSSQLVLSPCGTPSQIWLMRTAIGTLCDKIGLFS